MFTSIFDKLVALSHYSPEAKQDAELVGVRGFEPPTPDTPFKTTWDVLCLLFLLKKGIECSLARSLNLARII